MVFGVWRTWRAVSSRTHSLTLSLSHSLTPALSLSLSLSHTHSFSLSNTHTHSLQSPGGGRRRAIAPARQQLSNVEIVTCDAPCLGAMPGQVMSSLACKAALFKRRDRQQFESVKIVMFWNVKIVSSFGTSTHVLVPCLAGSCPRAQPPSKKQTRLRSQPPSKRKRGHAPQPTNPSSPQSAKATSLPKGS